jgi:hypothetical protein
LLDLILRSRADLHIDLSSENLQQVCAVLNEFALPRAIVDFERRTFVAWNPKFLERTGFTEDEMRFSKPEELLTFGESWFRLSGETEDQSVEYIACSTRGPFEVGSAPGLVVRAQSKMGYVMLDVFGSSAAFEQGRSAGQEEERNRIISTFHEEVSSPLIAALFLIQRAKNELEDTGLPQAETVSKASDILTETTEKIADVLGRADQSSG